MIQEYNENRHSYNDFDDLKVVLTGCACSVLHQCIPQSNYMGGPTSESGFISQSTTNPPSDTGHAEDDLGPMGNYSGAPSITPSSLYDLDSQNQSEVSSVHSFASEREVEDKIPNFIQAFHDSDQV